jgi:mono/diheme cytochrome c family protein
MKKIEPWKVAACLIAALALLAGCAPEEEAEPQDVEIGAGEEVAGEPVAEPDAVPPEARPEEEAPPQQESPAPEGEEAEPAPPAPAPLPVAEVAAAGKQVFLDQRCSTCHSVSTAGIEAKVASGPTAGGDLAGVGERRDRAAIEAIVRQEQTVGDGKKHPKGFTGSQEELEALIDWLAAQG